MAAPADFTILQIVPWTSLDFNGNPYESYRVTFETKHGDRGHVDLTKAGFTPEKAKAAVAAEAAKLITLRGS